MISKRYLLLFFFKERVKRWLKSKFKKYLDNEENKNEIFKRYLKFKQEIRQIFEIVNEKFIAKRIVQHLTQRISTIEYAIKFQKQINFTNWDDFSLIIMYRKKLKNDVKNELMRYDDKILNMNQLIATSIKLNDKLYERFLKRRNFESHERFDIYKNYEKNYRIEKSRFNKRNNINYSKSNYYESMSMKLNFTQRRKEKNSKEKQNNKNKTCYSCDKINHFSKDCRSKKLMSQRQINATLRKELEIETNWKKVVNIKNFTNISKVNSNDDYYLICDSKKSQKMFKDTTSQSIAITKSFNFNNNIVTKRSSTFYSSNVYSK